jgi:Holliday junction resolvasome RuvABC endonuclease subunit
MDLEKVLSLDISSKTGWAYVHSTINGIELVASGVLPQIHEPEGYYPGNYVDWAYLVFDKILELINKYSPDCLVIEETVAGSKAVYSQKFLEWVHFLVAKFIKESNIKAVYLLTGAWRSEVGAKMSKQESLHNKTVKKYKQKNKTSIAYDENGKRIGKLTKKHINISL